MDETDEPQDIIPLLVSTYTSAFQSSNLTMLFAFILPIMTSAL